MQPLVTWVARHWPVLALPAGLFLLTRTYHTAPFAHARARFTAGTVTGWHDADGTRDFAFRYAVTGTAYAGSRGRAAGPRDAPGTRCLVEYDSLAPALSVGHLDVPIPASIRHVPANGWRVPPFPVPAWITDHGNGR